MLTASTASDVPVINEWRAADKFHTIDNAEWWLTGNGGDLSFKWVDTEGTVFYVRLDTVDETNFYRLNVQFPPREAVSGERIKTAIKTVWTLLQSYADGHLKSGFVFSSVSKSLVRFMTRQLHFQPVEGAENEYVWMFEFEEEQS